MKKLKRFIIYLRLWFIHKMGYTLPSLRDASYVVPGELYDHFGRVVRAVPNNDTGFIQWKPTFNEDIPAHCRTCDLFLKGIPCPQTHCMSNGKEICGDYHFEVICTNKGNI